MNINLPGEPTIVVVRGVDAQYRYTELLRAQHIDCVARVNTDTLIQEHFPDYLRDRETCMKRPGWNGEHSRHLPDLRLRCLVVLARFATQSIIEISDEEVESIPICTSTEALEAELLHRMKCLATQYYGGPGLYRRADASQDPVPDWEVRPDRGLRLLYDALRRNTDQMDDHHAPIQSLAGIPGRAVTPCVGGTYIDWKSISVYFVQLRYEHQAAGASENHDLFTEVIRQWARSRLEDEHWTDDTDSDLRSNVYDMRRFHRPPNGRRPRRNRKGQVVAMKDLFLSNSGSPSHDTLVRGERDSAWTAPSTDEHRRRCERRQRQLQQVKQWQDWEGTGKVYIDVPGYDRIFLWNREGPGLPVVIERESISTLRQELAKPRSSGAAGTRGLELAIARFRYGIPDLTRKELTSGRLRWRFAKALRPA